MCGILANRDRQVFMGSPFVLLGSCLSESLHVRTALLVALVPSRCTELWRRSGVLGLDFPRPYATQYVMSGIWGERKNMALRTHQNSSSPPKCSKPKFELGIDPG